MAGDQIEKWRSLLIVLPLILLSTLLLGIVSAAIAVFGSRTAPLQIAVARVWSRSILFLARVNVEVEGRERLHARGPYVFVSNHLSFIDTPVALACIPLQFRFLAKEELFRWWPWLPIAWHLKTAGHVAVPIDDPRASVRALSKTAKLIESDGTSVFFFAEGGRSVDGTLGEFKHGAAYIAIKARAPMVPVALIGPDKILPMGSSLIRRGRVKLRIGHPIPTDGMTLKDRGVLTETVREELAGMLNGMTANAEV
jgi:1-acyl-sn-glycerol-3-phosphate acyltransferase